MQVCNECGSVYAFYFDVCGVFVVVECNLFLLSGVLYKRVERVGEMLRF